MLTSNLPLLKFKKKYIGINHVRLGYLKKKSICKHAVLLHDTVQYDCCNQILIFSFEIKIYLKQHVYTNSLCFDFYL